jgi:hypothetical protein
VTAANLAALRAQAHTQAQVMVRVLDEYEPGLSGGLQQQPLEGLRGRQDLHLQVVLSLSGTGCDVSGDYDGYSKPPVISVVHDYPRRMGFTALHEFGHHLTRSVSEDLGEAVYDHPDGDHFEELSCEAFASLVLLPDALVAEVIPTKGASAETVKTFFELSQASRTACCVRASTTLVGGGVVAVYNRDGVVQFSASTAPGVFPPARGSDQSSTPLIARALSRPGETSTHDQTFIAYSTHDGEDTLYGQATWIDDWIVAVAKADNVSWRDFAPPQERARRPARSSSSAGARSGAAMPAATSSWASCETRQDTFHVENGALPCLVCRQAICEKGHCGCTAKREVTCTGCWLKKGRAQFDAPDVPSPVCRECVEG